MNHKRSLRGRLKSLTRQSLYFLWIASLMLAMTPLVYAQEAPSEEVPAEETTAEKESAVSTYSLDYCEFSISFPEEPYTSRRCEDSQDNKCYDLISYTQVYELSSTVNFRVICNPIDETLYKAYDEDVMLATLRAMGRKSIAQEYNTDFREDNGYKQAGLAGAGQVGRTPTIYIAQIWIGKQSAFSVEAELIGEALEDADRMFSDILKTVHYSGVKDIPSPPKTEAPEKE